MSTPPHRVVYDCNVILQAVLSGDGPAFRCLTLVEQKHVELLLSEDVLAEARDVLNRPKILRKNTEVTPERIGHILDFVSRKSTFIENVASVVSFPRDPKDEPYLNLAVAGQARYLVTRDTKHLIKFGQEQTPEADAFRNQYPTLRIIDPPGFLREIDHEHGREEASGGENASG